MTSIAIPRIYADTSVFGGVFDDEFTHASNLFFEKVKKGELILVTSALVEDELIGAPSKVRAFFSSMLSCMEKAELTSQAISLRQAYIKAGIVGPKSSGDALHVAAATTNNCSVLVSWNCKHIVHFQKIPLYNAINAQQGFSEIAIYTPLEVTGYEN